MTRKISLAAGLALLVLTLNSSAVRAQSQWSPPPQPQVSRWYGAFTYNMAIPLSSTRDFSRNFSPLGFTLDGRYLLNRNLSVGLALAWQVFEDRNTGVFTGGNTSVHGTQLRFVNAMPLLANAHYYLSGIKGGVRPFVGFNLGTYFIERRVDIGLYTLTDSTWHFGMAPELGVAVPFNELLGVFNVRYHYAFSSSDSGDQSFVSFNIGIGWAS